MNRKVSGESHFKNTISVKPLYHFDIDYLEFHIHKSRKTSNQQRQQKSFINHNYSPHTIHKQNKSNINLGSQNIRKQQSQNKLRQYEYTNNLKQNDQEIKRIIQRYNEIKDGDNEMLKSIVQEELLSWMQKNNQILAKLNKYLIESLVLLGIIHTYKKEQIIPQWQGKICFVIYGRVKFFNKDIKLTIAKQQLFGEHLLFDCKPQLKVKTIQQTCLLMLPLKNYLTIREQSIKNGLKHEFSGIEIALRLSFIRKKLGESKKKLVI